MDIQEDVLPVIKIAVSGHRNITEEKRLCSAVRQVLEEITRLYTGAEIWLYSALAEGADQLAAGVGLEFPEIKLVVPLPLSQEEYFKDFLTEEGKEKFYALLQKAHKVVELPVERDHRIAYRQLGNYLVEQCDLLLAMWDGEDGRAFGGTGEVVENARAAGRKVYWIYCENGGGKTEKEKEVGKIRLLD